MGLLRRVLYLSIILVLATPVLSGAAFFGGPILIDPELNLPADPTIEQQIAAGKQQLDKLRLGDQTLDRNTALSEYFNSLAQTLLKAQDVKPPYPIVIHVSTEPEMNAYVMAGGQMVFYSRMVEEADTESQLVAILAHEMSHEIHNDFTYFWHAAKSGEDSYGKGGLLDRSREIEQRADLDATRTMYDAGWDPKGQLTMMKSLAKRWRMRRESHRVFYSTHPDDPERIAAIEALIATLPPKPGLLDDSPRFQEIKRSL
jgi:predicted Zn-dependent protease